MRSAISPEARRLSTPSAEHQREHLGAARRAVAEVAAIGHDVDLGHRHGDAAGKPGEHQEALEHRRRASAERARHLARADHAAAVLERGAAAEREAQGQHGEHAEQAGGGVGVRQPTVSMPYCRTGGQSVPAR